MPRGAPARTAIPRWSSGRRRRRGRRRPPANSWAVITLSGKPSRKPPCHNFSEARPSASSRSSPGQPSLCGASMPRRHPPSTWIVGPMHAHGPAVERCAACDRQADDAAADDGNRSDRVHFPPFAGMTRIRFDGKGRLRVPTLSPRFPGLPCRRPTLLSRVCITPPTGSPGWRRRRCICAPTPDGNAVIWPRSPMRRWRAGSTSSSCATRARQVRSSSDRWRRRDELAALEVLADAARRHDALLAVNDRADIARAARADVLHLGQDDLPLPIARDIVGPQTADRPLHPRPRSGRRRGSPNRWTTSASGRAGRRRRSPAGRQPDSTSSERPHRQGRTSRGSRSAASTKSGCPRCSTRARAASSWCGPSPRPTIRAQRRAGSKLGLQQRDSRRDGAKLGPAGREPRMQRQRRDLVLGHPAQFGTLPVRHGLELLRGRRRSRWCRSIGVRSPSRRR